MKKRIMTGDRPTGKLHVGHLVGSLLNRVALQTEYDQYVMIANVQALTDNFDNPSKVKESIAELLCDYYAVGIDFDQTTVYIQSEVPQIHEIFIYLANFATMQQLSHNPTIKTEIAQKGFESSTPLGFYIYPIHQSGDILCVNADLVPVGKDQAPMVEDCRELARKFNNTYGVKVLHEPEALFGMQINLPGIDGNAKMGKSLNNAIYLSDTEEELRKKVFMIKTDPNRVHATDSGTVEGNTVFIYHDIFNKNKEEVEVLKEQYRNGKVGDMEVKEKLFIAMNELLTPIRQRRIEAEGKKDELMLKAIEGSEKVRKIATGIVKSMKKAMKIEFEPIFPSNEITIEDYAKLNIKMGTIITAEKVQKADKLLRLEFDFGDEKRQVLTAMAMYYTPEELVGKTIPVLVNLEPRQMRGLESQGMLIATDGEDGKPVFLIPEKAVKNGTKVH
ncbi:MAG: tryptophan--tRNA ligase [Candidatus Roizmanbacteria bacterium]